MQLSEQGLDLIKQSEGFRAEPYRDVAGFPTIGYGHKITPPESFSGAITEAQATELLLGDVRQAEQSVARLVRVALTQGQFDALVDFCFNLGSGRLASSSLLKLLNAGQYASAGQQLLLWNHAGGQINEGLTARREGEFIFWSGVTTAAGAAA